MDYKFKTANQWKHQVVISDDGFHWDSSFYKYNEVRSIRGIPIKIMVNFAHYEHLDEFIFDLHLVNGSILRQEVKTLQRAKATAFIGSTNDAMNEISFLFESLANKTHQARLEKYNDYYNKYKRYLLMEWGDGSTVSGDAEGNIYKDEQYFGSWFPSENELDISVNNRDKVIRFRKLSSNFFSKDRDCHVDPFTDNYIITHMFQKIHLDLAQLVKGG